MSDQRRTWLTLVGLALLGVFAIWVSLPTTTDVIIYGADPSGEPAFVLPIRQNLGLDLIGGARVLLRAELPPDDFTLEDLRQTANNVSRRVNALGVTEPTIQIQGNNRILVELPNVTDLTQAVNAVQQTALLEFVDFSGLGGVSDRLEGQAILTTEQIPIRQARGEPISGEGAPLVNPQTGTAFRTVMTGAGLQSAAARLEQGLGWVIGFELTPEGSAVFAPFTARSVGQPMAIVLDGVVLSAPIIEAQLDTGGIISGRFTQEEAQVLALQLRSGALRVPLRVESSELVSASLGQESIELSIRSGIIGVVIVLLFMVIYYRVPGVAADVALLMFIALNLSLFKLIPITLTLPGITGFLIGIGTAVDGNILIFERIKEELRAGRPLADAVEAGFDRAWQSIRDSNLSTIIICGILFLFGQTPGASIVSGFAITLALSLILNLFTAIVVTRTVLRALIVVLARPISARAWLMGA